jgi:hypothetical protein
VTDKNPYEADGMDVDSVFISTHETATIEVSAKTKKGIGPLKAIQPGGILNVDGKPMFIEGVTRRIRKVKGKYVGRFTVSVSSRSTIS